MATYYPTKPSTLTLLRHICSPLAISCYVSPSDLRPSEADIWRRCPLAPAAGTENSPGPERPEKQMEGNPPIAALRHNYPDVTGGDLRILYMVHVIVRGGGSQTFLTVGVCRPAAGHRNAVRDNRAWFRSRTLQL